MAVCNLIFITKNKSISQYEEPSPSHKIMLRDPPTLLSSSNSSSPTPFFFPPSLFDGICSYLSNYPQHSLYWAHSLQRSSTSFTWSACLYFSRPERRSRKLLLKSKFMYPSITSRTPCDSSSSPLICPSD